MSIKITAICGSPHQSGLTLNALNTFLDFIDTEKVVSFFDVYKINPKPCKDCKKCEQTFKCIYDDLTNLYENMISCDLLIIASPIHNASLSSPLKCVIDRMQPMYFQRHHESRRSPIPKHAVVVTSQGSAHNYNIYIKKQISPNLRLVGVGNIHFLNLKSTDGSIFEIDNFFAKSENKINNIIEKICQNTKF